MPDFDATDDPVLGHQEQRVFHGHDDHHGVLPLYVFCGDELLTADLRPAIIDGATHARPRHPLQVPTMLLASPVRAPAQRARRHPAARFD